ncbi:hypothetical protein PLEOSDRAFT_1076260 [Pleurotus ostreatus PC15]|uniref:Urease accessory protein UreF n=1 Tax=Pleurotus ostreatus (strain PC15) TaxID=1137138 RepID=A0A067NRA6_PLEO1|nr:hypothetical protein PLEOSDRAFT_1076260 [Pleurotus ostreatus PC15]
MEGDDETYILLLLSDSNLPTGSFVASAGFESYLKHGFPAGSNSRSNSLETYARSALPFVSDAHRAVHEFKRSIDATSEDTDASLSMEELLHSLTTLDQLYHDMTLNHPARRASTAQGVALLTLFTKGFSAPPSLKASLQPNKRAISINTVVDKFKTMIRREETQGHLPICWGLLTGTLNLSLERSQYLHLFLHARSLLSASVRLNEVGPYGAQQLLLHAVRPLVEAETSRCRNKKTGILDEEFDELNAGPATTWPLGEILAGRHDLQHSRIFNS